MAAFAINTSAGEGTIKSSTEINEKISILAQTAAEKSTAISQQWPRKR